MMVKGNYTPAVKRIADDVRELSIGELVALREALEDDFGILPPDIGVREPRNPQRPSGEAGASIT